MKFRILRVFTAGLLAAFLIGGTLAAPIAHAEDPLTGACDSAEAKKSATCKSLSPDESPLSGTDGLLFKISVFISSIAGIIAVVIILVSGYRYMTSSGDLQKTAAAMKTLIGAVVGLIIIALSQTIIAFVVRRI